MTSTLELTRNTTVAADAAPEAPAGRRISVLDIARGIAILGTLATNVWIFTDPGGTSGISNGRCRA